MDTTQWFTTTRWVALLKNANTDRTIPEPVEPKDSWKEIVKDKNLQQSSYTEQHGSSSV